MAGESTFHESVASELRGIYIYIYIILLMQFQASDVTHRLICYSSVSYGRERPHSSALSKNCST